MAERFQQVNYRLKYFNLFGENKGLAIFQIDLRGMSNLMR
jgi:hypothetical protein